MSFQSLANKLVPFETFDRTAFVEDSEVSQRVCDFVLSLALAYNDFRDVITTRDLLIDISVDRQAPPSPLLALRNGIDNTIVRIQIGFMHELFKLINANSDAIAEPAFARVLRQMSKEGKKSWRALHDVATERPSNDPLANALLLIRNKVAFHYDSQQLGSGYRHAFFDASTFGEPLLSRGSSMSETRFYFADAASHAYILSKAKETRSYEVLIATGDLVRSINQALYEIVTRYIQLRSAWSRPH